MLDTQASLQPDHWIRIFRSFWGHGRQGQDGSALMVPTSSSRQTQTLLQNHDIMSYRLCDEDLEVWSVIKSGDYERVKNKVLGLFE